MANSNNQLDLLLRKESLLIKKTPIEPMLSCNASAQSFKAPEELIWIIKQTPALISIKDYSSSLRCCSNQFAQLGNLKTPDEINGKYDEEMPWGNNGYAEVFREEDKEVLDGNITYILGQYTFADKIRIALVKKVPLLDHQQRITGLINYVKLFQKQNITKITAALEQHEIAMTEALQKIIYQVFFPQEVQICLSPREEECLYYLLQGYALKQIARITNLTYRTVDFYLNGVKAKFNCHTQQSLIIKAIENGFLKYTPPCLSNKIVAK